MEKMSQLAYFSCEARALTDISYVESKIVRLDLASDFLKL